MGHSEHQSKNSSDHNGEKTVMFEMMPFFWYAAFPIILTIFIAYYFGTTQQ